MNREELVKEIAKSTKLSQKAVSEVLSATVESIQNTVKKGLSVGHTCPTINFVLISIYELS